MVAKCLNLNNLFSQRRPFAVSNDGRIVWATVLFLSVIMHWTVIYVNIFRFPAKFAGPRFVETQTFWYPGNEKTSPLYWDIFLFALSSYCKLRPSGVKSRKSGEARRELYICLLSNFFCIILNLYRNPLLASFIDKYYSPRSAAYSIIFTSLRRAHCRLSNYHDSCRIKLRIWIWTTWSNVHFNWCLLLTICTEKEVASYQLYPC